MKWFKLGSIFLVFLTLGTFIATWFAKGIHRTDYFEVVKANEADVWSVMSNIQAAKHWLQNIDSISSDGKGKHTGHYKDGSSGHATFQMSWKADSAKHKLEVFSEIPGKLLVASAYEIVPAPGDSLKLLCTIEVKVEGWLNRLMMSNIEQSLNDRLRDEIKSLIRLTGTEPPLH